MYKDFHYYGTYVAARYAGYAPNEAQIIAHAAQYVDDSIHSRLINKGEHGIDFQPIPTCHTTGELCWTTIGSGPSISELHQVWVPFHFLPGNYRSQALPDPNASIRIRNYTGPQHDSGIFTSWNYDDRAKWEFKLQCLPGSPISTAMINEITDKYKGQPHELHLIGLRMHVLADTAAHAYYAGTPAWHVNDAGAKVYDLTVNPKQEVPWLPTPGGEQSTPATTIYYDSIFYLGHGRMGSLPDYPWIKYEYHPKWSSTPIVKDNPVEYLKVFRVMVTALKCIKEQKKFDSANLEPVEQKYISAIDNILRQRHAFGLDNFSMTGATDFRCGIWKKAIEGGLLGPVGMPEEYKEDAWYNSVKQTQSITQTDYYKFNKAAIIHLESVQRYLGKDGIPFDWGKPIIIPPEPETPPVVASEDSNMHPMIPAGLKMTCMKGPDTLDSSATCPVIKWQGNTYWPYSHVDNRYAMTIVAYNSAGNIVHQWYKEGARYIWQITVDEIAKTVTFWGQSNNKICMSWNELLTNEINTVLNMRC
jgi:hypothetical protein